MIDYKTKKILNYEDAGHWYVYIEEHRSLVELNHTAIDFHQCSLDELDEFNDIQTDAKDFYYELRNAGALLCLDPDQEIVI